MTNLPMSPIEAEALVFARQRVAEMCAGFDPEAGRRLVLNMLLKYAMAHPDNMTRLKADARAGSEDADAALRELVKPYVSRGKLATAPQLADYVIEDYSADRPNKRGAKKSTKLLRNVVFVSVVAELVHRFNLPPTRNREPAPTRRRQAHSACSILAIALNEQLPDQFPASKKTERTIVDVWGQFGPTMAGWSERAVMWPTLVLSRT